MEHLFFDSSLSNPADVTRFEHDTGDTLLELEIRDYPRQRGWDVSRIWEGRLRESHICLNRLDDRDVATAVAAMLQSWLYFGLLESVLRTRVHVSYLVRADVVGAKHIFTQNLHACLQAWVFKIRLADDPVKLDMHHHALKTMAYVHSWVERLNIWTNPDNTLFYEKLGETYPTFTQLLITILPSIVRLAQMIDSARTSATPASTLLLLGLAWKHPQQVRNDREGHLIEKGWCLFTVRMLSLSLAEPTLDWLACLPAKSSLDLHTNCSGMECARNNTDPDHYEPSHNWKMCEGGCPNVKSPIEDVLDILRRRENCIPVVAIEDQGDGIRLSAIYRPMMSLDGDDYIAISHVWVDGLGSTAEVGIPECQARRLLKLGQNVSRKAHPRVWLDSLCIPAARDERKKAILLMADTYSHASTVLVIDKTIQQQRSCSPIQELYYSIFTSAWMQRLWTYQEACLARTLVFELAEDDLYTLTFPPQHESIGKTMIWRSFGAQLTRLRIDPSSVMNLGSVSRALNWRSTKRRIDELAAVAGLVQLSSSALGEILETRDQTDRMCIFLRAVRRLPRNILFIAGPKLTMAPFRWAPYTFMNRSELRLSTDPNEQTAECGTDGCKGTWLTLSLDHIIAGARTGVPSIHYVGSNWTKVSRSEAYVFRIYCKDGWPEPSSPAYFNTIVLNTELTANDSSVIDEGAWIQGLAVIKRGGQTRQSLPEPVATSCDYVGQVLVEKMRTEEALQYKPSLMFAIPEEGLTFGEIHQECLCVR